MNDTILIRSETCDAELKKAKEESTLYKIYIIVAAVCFDVFLFLPLSFSLSIFSENFFVSGLLRLIFFSAICFAAAFLFSRPQVRRIKALSSYISAAAVETLVVCGGSIYGSTAVGSFNLTYDNISFVRFYHRESSKEAFVPPFLNMLEITAVNGTVYAFYTFKNGSELKETIERQKMSA